MKLKHYVGDKMKWKIILKAGENPDDADSRADFDRTLEDYSYSVSIDMFADQNWIQTIKRILTPTLPKTINPIFILFTLPFCFL